MSTQIDPEKIIINASSLRFAELPDAVKKNSSNSFLVVPVGYPAQEIAKDTGFYLKLIVDNSLLAKVSTDRGMRKEADLLDTSNLMGLYGKYRNRPYLFDIDNNTIPQTRKHEGYSLIRVFRRKNIDTSYWGPLAKRPARILLYCVDLDSSNYPKAIVVR